MLCSGLSSFFSLGETLKAIDIMGEHGWVDMLTDVGRKLDRAESEGIARVAFYLRQNGQLQYAREVFTIYAPILRPVARSENPGGAGSTVVDIICPPWLR